MSSIRSLRAREARAAVLLATLILGSACSDPGGLRPPPTSDAPSEVVSAIESAGGDAQVVAESHRPDLRAARADLREADIRLAQATRTAGIVGGLLPGLTTDAYFLTQRAPRARGAAEILATLQLPVAPKSLDRFPPLRVDVSADAKAGYTFGQGTLVRNIGRGDTTLAAYYLNYWRREHGVWKVAAIVLPVGIARPQTPPPGFGTPADSIWRPFLLGGVPASRLLVAWDNVFARSSERIGLGAAFEKFSASDGVFLVAGSDIAWGPAAGREVNELPPTDTLFWKSLAGEVAPSGDLGFTIGESEYRSEGTAQFLSNYITIWRRRRGEFWRFVADAGTIKPFPTPAARAAGGE